MNIFLGLILLCSSGLITFSQVHSEKNKIPNDLQISLNVSGTVAYATYYRHTVAADGVVSMKYTRKGLPVNKSFVSMLDLSGEKSKATKSRKKDSLSKKQIRKILRAFESSGFFSMKDSYYGDPSLVTVSCVSHAGAKALSITANGKTKSVYFFLGCSYGDNPDLKNFLALFEIVHRAIDTVNVREIS